MSPGHEPPGSRRDRSAPSWDLGQLQGGTAHTGQIACSKRARGRSTILNGKKEPDYTAGHIERKKEPVLYVDVCGIII